jgi:hypothetical protein
VPEPTLTWSAGNSPSGPYPTTKVRFLGISRPTNGLSLIMNGTSSASASRASAATVLTVACSAIVRGPSSNEQLSKLFHSACADAWVYLTLATICGPVNKRAGRR